MDSKKFKMIDEEFVCAFCGRHVDTLNYTARDHCPYCLASIHVDNYPGDRLANCGGVLKPIGVEKSKKDNWKIVYRCDKCGKFKKNKMALDDDFDLVLKIMSNVK